MALGLPKAGPAILWARGRGLWECEAREELHKITSGAASIPFPPALAPFGTDYRISLRYRVILCITGFLTNR